MRRASWNILRDEIEAVAEAVKLRAIRDQCGQLVYVLPSGDLLTERVGDGRRKRDLPSEWLVGCYTSKAMCREIEGDLRMRYGEILP